MEVKHDVQLWGPLRAASPQREPLVRLADVVRGLMAMEDTAQAVAARRAIEALQHAALFELRPVSDAARIGSVNPAWRPEADEPSNRWPAPRRVQDWSERILAMAPKASDHDIERAISRMPRALRGYESVAFERTHRGALQWLAAYWVNAADALTDLDEGPGGRFAVLRADAVLAFPSLFHAAAPEVEQVAAPGVPSAGNKRLAALRVPDAVARDAAQRQASFQAGPSATFVAGRKWSEADKIAFGAAYRRLIAAGFGKAAALAELAKCGWAARGSTLNKRITEANEAIRASAAGRRAA